jgi:HPt (histidine-containing phosphotransfer) domain-containing protein
MNVSCVAEFEASPPINTKELLARCLGRVELMDKLLANFDEVLGPQIDQLELAVQVGDAPQIKTIAHRIKGAALTVAARDLSCCAEKLEVSAAQSNSVDSANCLEDVLRECERLTAAIRSRSQQEPRRELS